MANKEKKITARIRAKSDKKSFDDAKKDINTLKDSFGSLKDSLLSTKNSIGSAITAIKKITDNTDALETSQRLLKTTFGENTTAVQNYANNLSKLSGISETSLYKELALFGQTAKSLNMSSDAAATYSENITALSSKIAMLYNVSFDKAAESLRSAAKGATKSFASLTGVILKEENLQNTLVNLGINREASSLNSAERAMLQYISVTNQLINSDTDLQNAANSVGYQKQLLAEQVRRLATAFGQVLYPILQKILPILNAILIVITNIISSIAKLFGYNKKNSDTIKETSENFSGLGGSIAGAAKEAKKSLRTFDKLNNIQTPDAGGSGGSGGGGGFGISDDILKAFDDMQQKFDSIKNKAQEIAESIEKWFKKSTTDKLKDIWKWFKKLSVLGKAIVAIGMYVAIMKAVDGAKKLASIISTKLLNPLKALRDVAKESNTSMADAFFKSRTNAELLAIGIAGAVTAAVGLATVASGISKIKSEGANASNIIETLVGVLATVVGSLALVGAAATAMGVTFSASLAAATAGISLIVTAIVGLIAWMATAESSTTKLNKELEKGVATANEDIKSKNAQMSAIKDLSGELESLIDSNGKVQKSDEQRVNYILKEVNEALGTEYKLIDGRITQNGKLVGSYQDIEKEIDNYMVKLNGQYALEKYKDVYLKALDQQYEKQKLVNYSDDIYKQKLKEIDDAEKNGMITADKAKKMRKDATDAHTKSVDEITKNYKKSGKLVEQYSKLAYAVSTGDTKAIQEAYEKMYDNTTEISKKQYKTVDSYYKDVKTLATNALTSGMSSAGTQAGKDYGNAFKTAAKAAINGSQITTSTKGSTTTITMRKDGGFVDEGQLFIANEAGPELIGSMNGHTAVANNDQIVKGIEEASFQGMMKALMATGGNKTKVEITAEGDTSGLLDFINFKQKQADRRNGL